jgi:hypothetical protein
VALVTLAVLLSAYAWAVRTGEQRDLASFYNVRFFVALGVWTVAWAAYGGWRAVAARPPGQDRAS